MGRLKNMLWMDGTWFQVTLNRTNRQTALAGNASWGPLGLACASSHGNDKA